MASSIGGRHVAESHFGMVSSVEEHATRAGVAVLARGGNAVDAAVAVGFALAVTHPNAGNLGGGGFLLVHRKGSPTVAIDFRERAPRLVTQEEFERMLRGGAVGPAAAAVPGTVAGLDLALARYGTLPRSEVMRDAIRLAKHGFPLGAYQAKTVAWAWPALSRDQTAARAFGERGKPKKAGSLVVQPELAATLERIEAKGDAGFYEGETADAIAALAPGGGLVTKEDLAAYRAVTREPLRTRYRGLDVEVAPPSSAGGVAVVTMLGLFERLEPTPLPLLSAEESHLFAEIARRAHAVRRFEVGDPDTFSGWDDAAARRDFLDVDALLGRVPPVDPEHATPSKLVNPLFDAAMHELEHTTHFSVADAAGNVVSCTTTLSASFGAKVTAAGVFLNDSLAAFGTVGKNVLAGGRRPTSSMSPTLVLRGGEPVLVLGSPGGDTIPNTVVRVLRNVVDYGLTLDRAVDAPRLHHGFVPDEIRYESAHPPPKRVLEGLRRRGHRLAAPTGSIGDANVVLLVEGTAYGYADPREGGFALGPDREPNRVPAGSAM